jgi:3D (Asp-Asp-Asp) domain-containing protein
MVGGTSMNKPRLYLYGAILLLAFLTAVVVIFYARSINTKPMPENKPIVAEQAETTLTMQATAFCTYGWDKNKIDYGPGYCIVSSKGEIPLYALLEIEPYGEGQAIAVSDKLAPNEIQVWFNAPSKVPMFGRQEVKVKVKGKGDTPYSGY